MKVVVFGASGRIGQHVVSQLLAEGHRVLAVRRGGGAHPENSVPGLETASVPNLLDPDLLRPLIAAGDAVISAVGARSLKDGPVASTTTAAILRAMLATSVRRLVAVSATPVGDPVAGDGFLMRRVMLPIIKTILCDLYLDLARMEGEMSLSGANWTVIRPPRLVEGPLTGSYRKCVGGNVPNGYAISRANVAHAMCAALADATTIGQPVGVAD